MKQLILTQIYTIAYFLLLFSIGILESTENKT